MTMDVLRSSDYSNTKTYLKILHPTSGGGCCQTPPKQSFTRKNGGFKYFYSWGASLGNILAAFKFPGNLV